MILKLTFFFHFQNFKTHFLNVDIENINLDIKINFVRFMTFGSPFFIFKKREDIFIFYFLILSDMIL